MPNAIHRGIRTERRLPGLADRARGCARSGLTLIELILSVSILAMVAGVAYFSFDAGVRAWRAGTELADSLHHADYVLEQIVMGLRSSYYPDTGKSAGSYGFVLTDDGDGAEARDTMSWVKLGSALVGTEAPFAGIPHRVEVGVRDADEVAPSDAAAGAGSGFAVRAWRIDNQPEDFDPGAVPPVFLTPRVVGLNCRVLSNEQTDEDELKWDDEWEDTNRVPFAVEVSLYLQPPREDDEPIQVQRIVEIPLALLSWRDKGVKSPLDGRPTGQGAVSEATATGTTTGTRTTRTTTTTTSSRSTTKAPAGSVPFDPTAGAPHPGGLP